MAAKKTAAKKSGAKRSGAKVRRPRGSVAGHAAADVGDVGAVGDVGKLGTNHDAVAAQRAD